MEALETLSRRIESVRSLGSVVRTMKALAAVSIRQYEEAAQALVEYRHTIELGLRAALRDRLEQVPTEQDRAAEHLEAKKMRTWSMAAEWGCGRPRGGRAACRHRQHRRSATPGATGTCWSTTPESG